MSAAKTKKDFRSRFEPLPEMNPAVETAAKTESAEATIRISSPLSVSMAEMMKDYCYWNGLTQQQVIETALSEFLNARQVQARPDAIKSRPKTGRKPKPAQAQGRF
ncbi:MAG: hypothetical protein V4543_14905 [Bacteroidota bacterium]